MNIPKLPYGQGTMSLRKDGTIKYKKRFGNPKKEYYVYGKTPRECMRKMNELENSVGNNVSTADNTSLLQEEMERWLINVKAKTLKDQSYKRLTGTFNNQIKQSDLGSMRIIQIDSDNVQELINNLNENKYSFSTIKKTYDCLNEFFRYYSAKNKIDNPMLLVTMPTRNNVTTKEKEIEFFEQNDIDKFIKECGAQYKTGSNKYRYGYALAANIYLGMRAGELLALQWKDIDFDNNTIYIHKTLIEKDNPEYDMDNPDKMREQGIKKVVFVVQNSTKKSKNRYVPINSKAKKLLLTHKSNSEFIDPDDFVINTRNRKTTTIKNMSDTLKAIERSAETDVQESGTHTLRHTCASLYFRAGVPVETICQILGNSREVCEKTYIHFIEEQLKEAASKIDVIEI